jgi:hypothetical protein
MGKWAAGQAFARRSCECLGYLCGVHGRIGNESGVFTEIRQWLEKERLCCDIRKSRECLQKIGEGFPLVEATTIRNT